MATIKEDFVSFETSKLLKEKNCPDFGYSCICDSEGNKAQTQSIIMKWLREEYNIFISVNIGNHKKDNRDTSTPDFVYYFFYITDTKAVYEEKKQCHKEFSTFEEACEEAIKYCLENLI